MRFSLSLKTWVMSSASSASCSFRIKVIYPEWRFLLKDDIEPDKLVPISLLKSYIRWRVLGRKYSFSSTSIPFPRWYCSIILKRAYNNAEKHRHKRLQITRSFSCFTLYSRLKDCYEQSHHYNHFTRFINICLMCLKKLGHLILWFKKNEDFSNKLK